MTWPKIPFQVGSYKSENVKQAVVDIEIFEVYHLGKQPFYGHDHEATLKKFCKQHNITWKYTHKTWLHEEEYKRSITLQEVEAKLGRKQKDSQRVNKPRDMMHENFAQEEVPMQIAGEEELQESTWTITTSIASQECQSVVGVIHITSKVSQCAKSRHHEDQVKHPYVPPSPVIVAH